MVNQIVKKAPELFKAVLVSVISAIEDLAANASTFTSFVSSSIASIIKIFSDKLPVLIQAVVTLLVNLFDAVVKNLPQILQALVAAIPVIIEAVVAALPLLVNSLSEAIPQIIVMLIQIIPDVITALIKSLPDIIVAALLYGFPAAVFARIAYALIKASPQIVAAIVVAFARIFTDAVPQLFVSVGRTFTLFFSQLDQLFFKDMYKVGGHMLKGLAEGIKKSGNIWPEIKKVFTKLVDAVKNFFGIHSPSTVFFDIGLDIIRGLINGILSAGGRIGSALAGVLKSAMSAITSLVPSFVSIGARIGSSIVSGMSSALSGIGSAVSSAGGGISGIVNTATSAAGSSVKKVRKVFGFASGTSSAPGGWSVVGEKGQELMNLKAGSTILSASDSIRAVMAALAPRTGTAAGSGSATFVGEISAADVVIDGNTVGKIAFRYIDRQVKAAYGA